MAPYWEKQNGFDAREAPKEGINLVLQSNPSGLLCQRNSFLGWRANQRALSPLGTGVPIYLVRWDHQGKRRQVAEASASTQYGKQ